MLVEIPWDTCKEEADSSGYVPSYKTKVAPENDAVKAAAKALAEADKPVIYAGQGINYAKAWDELKEIAELINAPVTTSLEGKSTFNETHPLSIGSGGHATPKAVYHFINEADLIFGIGCSFAFTAFGTRMPENKKVINATLDPMDLNKDVSAELGLIGDAKLTVLVGDDAWKTLHLCTATTTNEANPHTTNRRRN